jgi:hypothetical protein
VLEGQYARATARDIPLSVPFLLRAEQHPAIVGQVLDVEAYPVIGGDINDSSSARLEAVFLIDATAGNRAMSSSRTSG